MPDKTQTSVCAGPLYAFDSGQGILCPEVLSWAVWTSLRGIRVPPRPWLGMSGSDILSWGSGSTDDITVYVNYSEVTWWPRSCPRGGVRRCLPRLLTIVRGSCRSEVLIEVAALDVLAALARPFQRDPGVLSRASAVELGPEVVGLCAPY